MIYPEMVGSLAVFRPSSDLTVPEMIVWIRPNAAKAISFADMKFKPSLPSLFSTLILAIAAVFQVHHDITTIFRHTREDRGPRYNMVNLESRPL
jgi:hypothetical protein